MGERRLTVSLRDLVTFFVEFEKALLQAAPRSVMDPQQRDPLKILEVFQIYSNCKFEVDEDDFSNGMQVNPETDGEEEADDPKLIWSLILNFGGRAEIIINSMLRPNTKKRLVNRCYTRFLTLKEAYHVILRDEFLRRGLKHPDTKSPEAIVTLVEGLSFMEFTMVDFDSPDYKDELKVENAAELFAFLTLYPLDNVAGDLAEFRAVNNGGQPGHPQIIVTSTLVYAERYAVPRRFFDRLIRWHRFEDLHLMYRQIRDGYTAP
jgi:hypothetical protein